MSDDESFIVNLDALGYKEIRGLFNVAFLTLHQLIDGVMHADDADEETLDALFVQSAEGRNLIVRKLKASGAMRPEGEKAAMPDLHTTLVDCIDRIGKCYGSEQAAEALNTLQDVLRSVPEGSR